MGLTASSKHLQQSRRVGFDLFEQINLSKLRGPILPCLPQKFYAFGLVCGKTVLHTVLSDRAEVGTMRELLREDCKLGYGFVRYVDIVKPTRSLLQTAIDVIYIFNNFLHQLSNLS